MVLVHGGVEWSAFPSGEQKMLYRRIVRNGADLVVGSHPHVLQGMEVYGNGLIAYSLGNFLFPGMEGTPGGTDSVILRVGVWRGKTRYVQAFGVRLSGLRVRQDQTRSIRLRFLESTRALNEPR